VAVQGLPDGAKATGSMSKWHREVYWKPEFERDIEDFFRHDHWELHFTNHAQKRITGRGLPYPTLEQIAGGYIFEIEDREEGGYKLASRFPIDGRQDMTVVILKDSNGYVVKSVWACRSTDTHRTLRVEEYERG
jgi:hypothetical protein